MLEGTRQYEISFLTLREGDKETVKAVIAGAQGEILSEGRYAEIRLAYPINKQTSAFFGSIVFSALPEKAPEIEKKLRFAEGVLRSLIVTPVPAKPTKSFASEEAPKAEKKETEAEVKSAPVDDNSLDEKLQEILG